MVYGPRFGSTFEKRGAVVANFTAATLAEEEAQEAEQRGVDAALGYQVIISGRKVGVGMEVWALLAEDENLSLQVAEFVRRHTSCRLHYGENYNDRADELERRYQGSTFISCIFGDGYDDIEQEDRFDNER